MLKSEEIGRIISTEKKKQKITFKKLAEKTGCSSRVISMWISGERTISLNMADKILKELEVTVVIGKEK